MLKTMNSLGPWDELADALRDELAEYGGLLSLLDEQRDAIIERKIDALSGVDQKVQEQTAAAIRYRNIREEVCARLASNSGVEAEVTVKELLAYTPAGARPMFEALVIEGMDVALKAQYKVKRNSSLLSRAGELNEKLISTVAPSSTTKTYNARGSLYLKSAHSRGNGLDLSA